MEASTEAIKNENQDWDFILAKGPKPTPKNGHTLVEHCGSLYSFGGYDGVTHFNQLDCLNYDQKTRQAKWIPVATSNPPTGRTLHSAVVHNDCMYVFGGVGNETKSAGLFTKPTTQQVEYNDLYQLNFDTMVWSKVPTLGIPPKPRDGHSAIVVNNLMYLFGGSDDIDVLNDLFTLDLTSFTWNHISTKGAVPSPRRLHTCILYNKNLFVFGGYDGKKCFDDVFKLNLSTNVWEHVNVTGNIPPGRYGCSATLYNKTMYVFGGYGSGKGYSKEMYTLDMETNEWQLLENSENVIGRRKHCAIEINDEILVFGGLSNKGYLNDLLVYKFPTKVSKIPVETHIQDLKKMLNNKFLSDVTIKVGDQLIYAHKNILSYRCAYFHSLFSSNMKESIQGEVEIKDSSYEAVYALLMYLYTGEIQMQPQIAFEVMKLSQSYLLDRLKVLCEIEVTAGLDVENAADLLMEAEKYGCSELKEYCLKFIVKYYKEVVATEGFKTMPKELMLEVMTLLSNK